MIVAKPAVVRMSTELSGALSNPDFGFFFRGLEQRLLLVQRCAHCGRLRNPPGPMCPECRSFHAEECALSGAGTVFSYVVHHYPPLPTFPTPHIVIVVDMAEGIRVVGSLSGVLPEDIRIGLPVKVDWYDKDGAAAFRFIPAAG